MKNLFYVVFVLGCSSTGGQFPPFFVGLPDSGQDSSIEDAGPDTDTDTDSLYDSGVDSGTDDGGTPSLCDGGSCCSEDGGFLSSGTPCILDDLPEDAAEGWSSSGLIPQQFRCVDEGVCGSGEMRRVGEVVCGGSSPYCRIQDISWGSWEVTIDDQGENVGCYAGGASIVWRTDLVENQTSFTCWDFGCSGGICLPGPEVVEGEECDNFQCGDYCVADTHNVFNCGGVCGYSCRENGGDRCVSSFEGATEPEDTECRCGEHPACLEGTRCVYDDIVSDFTCIPE